MDGFDILDYIYRRAVDKCTDTAAEWAEKNKNENCIYVMAGGAAYGAASIFSICNIEEMLQKASPTINVCDFFHGPFEILNKETSLFMILSEGRGRSNDERAVQFLKKYGGENIYFLDIKDLGIEQISNKVSEYFNHLILSPLLNNVYMRRLSYTTAKDYHTRTYMWKVPY